MLHQAIEGERRDVPRPKVIRSGFTFGNTVPPSWKRRSIDNYKMKQFLGFLHVNFAGCFPCCIKGVEGETVASAASSFGPFEPPWDTMGIHPGDH